MKYIYRKFQPETDVLEPFDCGDADLNGFLLETDQETPNATFFEREHLACTYIVESNETHRIVAYFSLLNDKIDREVADNSIWNRLSRAIPNAKRRSSYPALKVGRLAISREAQGSGIGRQILNFVQTWFYNDPKSGCRFITVDALLSAENFYRHCDFKRLAAPSPKDETVLMFFDLKGITRQRMNLANL
ncbi:MAG: GNAT family N-acetyltransferase [Bacteroidales bacterium]|nr:GNAT family N-acetyltransferase [Bacteroidales bacterium]